MGIESLTLADLVQLEPLEPFLARFAKRLLVSTYGDFADVLNDDLDEIVGDIECNPQLRQSEQEDRVTHDILCMLHRCGYDASHDEAHGGHADIVVTHRLGFKWIGEAKFDNDLGYVFGGFQQLCTRYSPGTEKAQAGGLLIYARAHRSFEFLCAWRDHLRAMGLDKYTDEACEKRTQLAFYSIHTHQRTGLPFRVRHVAVTLKFDPQDGQTAKARSSAVRKAAKGDAKA